MLALYHNTIFGWHGIGGWGERSNFDEINLMAAKWKGFARNTANSLFDDFFLKQFDNQDRPTQRNKDRRLYQQFLLNQLNYWSDHQNQLPEARARGQPQKHLDDQASRSAGADLSVKGVCGRHIHCPPNDQDHHRHRER